MINSKQRAYLRSLAQTESTIIYVGKAGITDAVVTDTSNALTARELIKGCVLETSLLSAREACDELAQRCRADGVQVIGNKFVLYKRNEMKPKIDISTHKNK